MDIRDFSIQLAEATKNMSAEERASLIKLFEGVSKNITKEEPECCGTACADGNGVPDGITGPFTEAKRNLFHT